MSPCLRIAALLAASVVAQDGPLCADEIHEVNFLQSHKALELASATRDSAPLIPNMLSFNHKVNLLEGPDCPEKRTVQKIIAMHPNLDVLFYNDEQCREAIVRVHSEELAQFFDTEPEGFFKSDSCRVAMLLENGGYYFDNDVDVVQNVQHFTPPTATFISASAGNPTGVQLHQGFIASVPRHPVLLDSLHYTLEFYKYNAARNATGGARAFPPKYSEVLGIGEGVESWLLLGPQALALALMDWSGVKRLPPGGRLHSVEGHDLAYLFNQTQPEEGINETYGFAWRGCEVSDVIERPPKLINPLFFCNLGLVDVEQKELLAWTSTLNDCCSPGQEMAADALKQVAQYLHDSQ